MMLHTHKGIKRLVEAGLDQKIAEAIIDFRTEHDENIVTKKDLALIEQKLSSSLIIFEQNIRSQLQSSENNLRSDIKEFRSDFQKEISEARGDIKSLRTGASWNMAIVIAIFTILLTSVIKYPL